MAVGEDERPSKKDGNEIVQGKSKEALAYDMGMVDTFEMHIRGRRERNEFQTVGSWQCQALDEVKWLRSKDNSQEALLQVDQRRVRTELPATKLELLYCAVSLVVIPGVVGGPEST